MGHYFAEASPSIHHHVHGPAIRRQGVSHIVYHPLVLTQRLWLLHTQELGGGHYRNTGQELIYIITTL